MKPRETHLMTMFDEIAYFVLALAPHIHGTIWVACDEISFQVMADTVDVPSFQKTLLKIVADNYYLPWKKIQKQSKVIK